MIRQLLSTALAGFALAAASVGPAQTAINRSIKPVPAQQQLTPASPQAEEAPHGNGFLGVYLEDGYVEKPGDRVKADLHWGAQIKSVTPDSAAADAGLKEGDLILSINGKEVRTSEELSNQIATMNAGDKVTLKLLREEKEETVTATLKERPSRNRGVQLADPNGGGANTQLGQLLGAQPMIQFGGGPSFAEMDKMFEQLRSQMDNMRQGMPDPSQIQRGLQNSSTFQSYSMTSSDSRLGVTLQNLTPQLREFFGAPEGVGALVAEVAEGSTAKSAGLKAGDVLTELNGQTITSPLDAQRAFSAQSGGALKIEVIRDKAKVSISAKPATTPDSPSQDSVTM
jgi:S1-C subfamily serine protease